MMLNTILKILAIILGFEALQGGVRRVWHGHHGVLWIMSPAFKLIAFIAAVWLGAMLIHPGLFWYELQHHIAGPLGLFCLMIGLCTLPGWLRRQRQPLRRAQAYRRRDADAWATGRKRAAHVKRDGRYFPWSDNIPFGDEK